MTKRSSKETEALIKRLRERGNIVYLSLGGISLAAGGLAFSHGLSGWGAFAFVLAAILVFMRYQDALYANQLESDQKREAARDHDMKAIEAWVDKVVEKLEARTKALNAETDAFREQFKAAHEQLEEEQKMDENLSERDDSDDEGAP
jgi:uncharacterized protein YlxW (UPF0749 family)